MHLSRPGRRKWLATFYLLATLCLITPSMAIWPFPPKRFRGNSLIDAGAMGLSGDGRVVAFGDFNGDQLWVFILMYQLNISNISPKIGFLDLSLRSTNPLGLPLEPW